MRRTVIGGGILLAAMIGSAALVGSRGVQASEPYEKATGLKCENCHKHTKEQFEKNKITGYEATQDLKDCGKESLEFLKKQPGFKDLKKGGERSKAEARKWALALVKGRWKCSKQSAPGKPIQ